MSGYDFSRLKGRMAECGYTQGKLAKAIGISYPSFSMKINGKRDFTLTELRTMALVLQMKDPNYYFFEQDLKKS